MDFINSFLSEGNEMSCPDRQQCPGHGYVWHLSTACRALGAGGAGQGVRLVLGVLGWWQAGLSPSWWLLCLSEICPGAG